MPSLRFDWNDFKNRSNIKQHGVSFEEARKAFDDPLGRVFYDDEHSLEEDRFLLLGCDEKGRLFVISHTFREQDQQVRIISARYATGRERESYEERV